MKNSKILVIVFALLLVVCLVGGGIMYSNQSGQIDTCTTDLVKAKDEIEVLRASLSDKDSMILELETEKIELLETNEKHISDKERLTEDVAVKQEELKTAIANYDEWGVYIKPEQLIGKWETVDFLEDANKFDPNNLKASDLFIRGLIFTSTKVKYILKDDEGRSFDWSDDALYDENTVKEFKIKTIDDVDYLILEWKSGDYYLRDQPYDYYVFKRAE